jgi:radical SAM superfamily enzyme YgiQ (UPF0313 family)
MIGPDTLCIGISVMSGAPIKNAIAIGRFAKSVDASVPVVWGGPHATFYPDTILRDEPSCDYAVSGYAARPFRLLCEALQAGQTPEKVPAICWRQAGEIRINKAEDAKFEFIDWQDIPYHLIEDFDAYGQLEEKKRIFSMYSAMGCPYQCTFCSSPAQYANVEGKKWVPLDVQNVVDHIAHVVERYGANYIYFIDDDSFPNLKHVEGIIDEIKRRGLPVKLGFRGARINELKKMSDAFLTKLAQAGTDILHIGAECGSDRILAALKKNCTASDIIEVNRKLARHPEIRAAYNFIMGIPGETIDDLKLTRDLMMRLADDHPNCIIFPPNKFRPLPGTELYNVARDSWGYEMPSTLEAWANIEVEGNVQAGWYDPEMRRFCNLLLIASYFVDNKVVRLTEGNSPFYKFVRLVNLLYRPFALFRLKHGLSRGLFEYHAYRFLTQALQRFQGANS